MTFGLLLDKFFADDKLKILLVVIAIDFLLGVVDSIKQGTFRLAYVADFARNDILFKVVPWFVVYAGAVVAGQQVVLFGGITVGVAAGSLYALVLAAMGASIVNSLVGLGFGEALTSKLAGSRLGQLFAAENDAPPKD